MWSVVKIDHQNKNKASKCAASNKTIESIQSTQFMLNEML